MCISIFA
jgi:hypothetical protein